MKIDEETDEPELDGQNLREMYGDILQNAREVAHGITDRVTAVILSHVGHKEAPPDKAITATVPHGEQPSTIA